MMFAVVYLSAKLGQVSGRGLFQAIRDYYSRWTLYPTLVGVLIGNTVEAGADLGGMAAALNLFVPLPVPWLCLLIAAIVVALQIYGSYVLIRNVFRWLALVLLAYVGAAVFAQPNLMETVRGTPPLREPVLPGLFATIEGGGHFGSSLAPQKATDYMSKK